MDALDLAVVKMIKQMEEMQEQIADVILNPPEDQEYDQEVLIDKYNQIGKILTELKRIDAENKKDIKLERIKIIVPVVVAIIGLIGTIAAAGLNIKFNMALVNAILRFEETGTIKSLPGKKFIQLLKK